MKKLLRRFVSLVLAVSVLAAAFVYRPPKANAFAVTSAAIVAGVCAIMASIGVTYWAKSTSDAQDYITQKLDEYLRTLSPSPESLQDWLGLVAENTSTIFQILSGNRLRFMADVGNKILDFCRWLQSELSLEGGGEAYTVDGLPSNVTVTTLNQGSSPVRGNVEVSFPAVNVLRFTLSALSWNRNDLYHTAVAINGLGSCTLTCSNVIGNFNTTLTWGVYKTANNQDKRVIRDDVVINTSSYAGEYTPDGGVTVSLNYSNNGDYATTFTGSFDVQITRTIAQLVGERKIAITPSNVVSVPSALEPDEELVVTPSAPITQDMTVDDAADSIFEQAASTEGLTAGTAETVVGVPAAWIWLHDLLTGFMDTVLSIPGTIVSGISSALERLFVPTEAFIDSYVATLYGDFDNHFSILSYPFSALGEFITRLTQSSQQEPIFTWGDITEPFSGRVIIPAGSYNLNDSLQNSTFAYAHSLYFIVVKGWISFWFLSFLYHWFCDVFKMREADMENPNLDEDFV